MHKARPRGVCGAPHVALLMWLVFCLLAAKPAESKSPHIILFLADDFGYGNLGYHRNTREQQTPNLDALAASGLKLERFYSYKICSPSRSSFQTGRLAVHVNTENLSPTYKDAGIPPNMTGIAAKLKRLGYATHMVGKWDVGMASHRHTPLGRGYDTFLGYFHHANDYWTCGVPLTAVGEVDICLNRFLDLWRDNGPAVDLAGKEYVEETFKKASLDILHKHNKDQPLFLVHSFHLVHSPLQVPRVYFDKFSFIEHKMRRQYAAMVFLMDEIVGEIVAKLKSTSLYEDALIIFFSDNGGPVYLPGAANNYPLRGGKYSDFEGGVRVNAFVGGGALPEPRRGEVSQDLISVADLYGTLLRVAKYGTKRGGPVADFQALIRDDAAAAAGLPAVDSIDAWPVISGDGSDATLRSKRTQIQLSSQCLLDGKYKLVIGKQPMDIFPGPQYPNATGATPSFVDTKRFVTDCGPSGCLFDVFADPTEHVDLASALPELRLRMMQKLAELNKSLYAPNRGRPDFRACIAGRALHRGFYGPYVGDDLGTLKIREFQDDVAFFA